MWIDTDRKRKHKNSISLALLELGTSSLKKLSAYGFAPLEQTKSIVEMADTSFSPDFTNLVPSISMTLSI